MALTRENLAADPKIWKKFDNGTYRIIFASPEILMNATSYFRKHTLVEHNSFRDRLALVCVDEAHCIWGNGEYRPEYAKLGHLRDYLSNVPFLAMSATMPPHIMASIQKVLGMQAPTNLIACPGRKKNLDILICEMASRDDLTPLESLIPIECRDVYDIPKTLIFADSVLAALKIAIRLRNVLHLRLPDARSTVTIRTYYASIDAKKKRETRDLLESGSARIVVCTDSMSLGINIPDILRVVQWGVNEKLDLNTLWQRFGRAARDPTLQGLGVVYVRHDIVDPVRRYRMEDWKNGIDRNVRHELRSSQKQPDDGVDDDSSDDDDKVIPRFQNRILDLFSLPVMSETIGDVQSFRAHMYLRVRDHRQIRQKAKEERHNKRSKKSRRKPVDLIDPSLLWFINTVGCRHRCVLSYLKYPDVFDDILQKSWCCDNCAIRRGPEKLGGLATAGMSPSESIFAPRLPPRTPPTLPPALPRIAQRILVLSTTLPRLMEELRRWRQQLNTKLLERKQIFPGCPVGIVIPDNVIVRIAKDVRTIHEISDLRASLAKANYDCDSSILREKDLTDIFNIIDTIAKQCNLPVSRQPDPQTATVLPIRPHRMGSTNATNIATLGNLAPNQFQTHDIADSSSTSHPGNAPLALKVALECSAPREVLPTIRQRLTVG